MVVSVSVVRLAEPSWSRRSLLCMVTRMEPCYHSSGHQNGSNVLIVYTGRHVESRVIPVYGGADIDAVLLTDTDFRPGAYKLWKGILAFLGLKYVFWDISWYRTYSMEDVPWLGKHRLVIFTHLQEDNFNSLTHWVRDVLPPHISALGGVRGIDNAAGNGRVLT